MFLRGRREAEFLHGFMQHPMQLTQRISYTCHELCMRKFDVGAATRACLVSIKTCFARSAGQLRSSCAARLACARRSFVRRGSGKRERARTGSSPQPARSFPESTSQQHRGQHAQHAPLPYILSMQSEMSLPRTPAFAAGGS